MAELNVRYTSRIAPGFPALSYVSGARYLACDAPSPEFPTDSFSANTFYLGNTFFVKEDVTFTKITMLETAAGSAGTVRAAVYDAESLARVMELGNISFSGAAAERSTSSLSLSFTRGQKLRLGLSFSAAINCTSIRLDNSASYFAMNAVLMMEQGVPSWANLTNVGPGGNVAGGGSQAFVYTGTTTPTTAAPTASVVTQPALWFSK